METSERVRQIQMDKMMFQTPKEDFDPATNKLKNYGHESDLYDRLVEIYEEAYADFRAYKKSLLALTEQPEEKNYWCL